MASSLLALLDDIATLLDDVAVLTKVAAKKTAGVLGDDLALNAQQVAGVSADRELPVVWAVAKGSLLNKAILVPAALRDQRLRALGGDAAADDRRRLPLLRGRREARAQVLLHRKAEDDAAPRRAAQALADPQRRSGRVRAGQDQGRDPHRLHPLGRDHRDHARHGGRRSRSRTQVAVLVGDRAPDDGRRLRPGGRHREARRRRACRSAGRRGGCTCQRALGARILRVAPWLMKFLSVAGTAAMFLVGGGILTNKRA